MLLTLVTMLKIRCLELIHLMTQTLFPLTNIPPFPLVPGNHHSTLCCHEFSLYIVRSSSIWLCLTCFTWNNTPQVSSMLLQVAGFSTSLWLNNSVCVFISLFIHSSVDGHFSYFHVLAVRNKATMSFVCIYLFEAVILFSLDIYSE